MRMSAQDLLFGLDHEVGHIRDHQLVAAVHPASKIFFETGKIESQREYVGLANTYIALFRRRVPQVDVERFDLLRRATFGDFSSHRAGEAVNILWFLSEFLRTGEEVHDPRFEILISSASFSSAFGRKPPYEEGWGTDPLQVFRVASLKEAGLWEKFTKQPGYNLKMVERVDSRYVEFFRMCIRAASTYFPVIASERTLSRH